MSAKDKAWRQLIALAVAMALAIFVPAGTLNYWQGFLHLAVFVSASIVITSYLAKHDPALLQRRLLAGPQAEGSGVQRFIMAFVSIGFIALLVVPGLDRRFGWSQVPPVVSLIGEILVAAGFYVVFLVFKTNTHAAGTIQVESGQRVISGGPYAVVRHPLYAGGLTLLLGTPLGLGSWWGLLVFAAMASLLVWRLVEEERFLAQNLGGYADYQRNVRWRLLPGVY